MGILILMAFGMWAWWRILATEQDKEFLRQAGRDIREEFNKWLKNH